MNNKEIIPQQTVSILGSLAGELSVRSRRIYEHDAAFFARWLQENQITPQTITKEGITCYRAYLLTQYAPATAKRMYSVACRLLEEQVQKGLLPVNPSRNVRGIKADDESPYIALTLKQARELLDCIDNSTLKGKRDYALILTLLCTGLRRFECAALTLGDMSIVQGHHVLTVYGKGNRRSVVKLRVEAYRAIQEYLLATHREEKSAEAPLFCQFRKGGVPVEAPISTNVIYRTVMEYAKRIQIDALTPHGLRATFITLALEDGAKLEQVQYAARHKDPRTTERYQQRKTNLDDNAVDHIHLF